MSNAANPWVDYKQAILNAREDLTWVYQKLEGLKPSGNGWIAAKCPFHDDSNPSFAFEKSTGNWKCHAGCGEGNVFDFRGRVDGLQFPDSMFALGDELGISRPVNPSGQKTTYDYLNKEGKILFQVVKSPGKKFWQRRLNRSGKWVKNLKGVQRVLYRLPGLMTRPDETVYIVEGEKDADRLHELGLLATTNPGGAGKWKPEYNDPLTGRDVVILPDNDAPGRAHAAQVAVSLREKSKSVRIVELPDLPDKGDVSDWLDAGGERDKLEVLTTQIEPVPDSEEPVVVGGLPVIELHDRPLREVLDDAWSAILSVNDPPAVFNSAGQLARLRDLGNGLQIEFLKREAVTGLLARSADWIRTKGTGSQNTKPPKEAADELVFSPHPDLPALDSVIRTPVFDRDWRLLTEQGYHLEARVWLELSDEFGDLEIPVRPSQEEVEAAMSLLLDDLLVDFPFTSDSDRTHAVAAILLPFTRRMFKGPAPIHLIEAPVPGSGKSLLAEMIGIIALGIVPGSTTLTRNEEESRKKLTAILATGPLVVTIDNIEGGLWSSQFASAITATRWEDRLLGKTQMVTFPNRALWLVSGNNPKLSMEIARRCIRIRINPREEMPWLRTGFTHDPIREWVVANRVELVRAILILIQSWIAAGSPFSDQILGSFESWSRHLGGMLEHLGMGGFLGDTEEFYAAADPETEEWRAFILLWWEKHKGEPVAPARLMELAIENALIPFAYVGSSDRAQLAKFGKSLLRIRDRKFGDYEVIATRNNKRGSNDYRLIPEVQELFSNREVV